MPYVRRAAPDVIATATSQRWEHAEVLKVLLAEEAAGRDRATIRTRRRASGLPAGKTLDAWEPERSVILVDQLGGSGEPVGIALLACQARELAFELLELAEQADRERTGR